VQQDNQDRSYEIRHDVSFGGGTAIRPVKKRTPEKVRDVFIATFGGIGEPEVRKKLRITEGRIRTSTNGRRIATSSREVVPRPRLLPDPHHGARDPTTPP
jgi:hypothetical protein